MSEIRLNVGNKYLSITLANSFPSMKQIALANEEFFEGWFFLPEGF